MIRPLPTSADLPEEVPIRSGVSSSAPPPATVSPEGAAGRAEVTAQVGAAGCAPAEHSSRMIDRMTSAVIWAEVKLEMASDPERGYLLALDYWIGRAERAERDADLLYRFALTGGTVEDRQAVLTAHLEAKEARG